MLEMAMIAAFAVLIGREASARNESPIIWGVITAALCFASTFLMPSFPFVRVFLAGGVMLAIWIGYLMVRDRPR